MAEAKKTFKDMIGEVSEPRAAELVDHPDAELICAYREGVLPQEKDEEIAEHLALCRSCSQSLLDLEASLEDEPPQNPQSRAQAWQELTEELGFDPALEHRKRSGRAPLLALAASLIFTFGAWLTTRDRGPGLRPNTAIVDLVSVADLPRANNGEQSYTVPAFATELTLRLVLAEPGDFDSYRVALYMPPESEKPFWSTDEAKLQPGGEVTISVPLTSITGGRCRIVLSGPRDGAVVDLAEYRLSLDR